jgi:hypothetical protein
MALSYYYYYYAVFVQSVHLFEMHLTISRPLTHNGLKRCSKRFQSKWQVVVAQYCYFIKLYHSIHYL